MPSRDETGLHTSAAEFLDGLLALVVRARANDHARPATDESMGSREAEATRAARDEGDLPANVLTMRSSFLSREQDVAYAMVRSNHHTSLMLRTSLRPNVQR